MAPVRSAQCNDGMLATLAQRPALAALRRRARFDVSAAGFASLVAGVLALVLLEAASITIYDEPAWKLPRMAAALLLGPRALEPDDEFSLAVVGAGILVHVVLALGFGTLIARIAAFAPRAAAAWIGLACGIVLYAIDLHGATRFFPWFEPMRTADTLLAHALFGIAAAAGYRHLAD
jgi:hypothetical protein